jgi:hypothetical protein
VAKQVPTLYSEAFPGLILLMEELGNMHYNKDYPNTKVIDDCRGAKVNKGLKPLVRGLKGDFYDRYNLLWCLHPLAPHRPTAIH